MNKIAKFLKSNINDELANEYLFYYETRYKLTAIIDYLNDPKGEIIEALHNEFPNSLDLQNELKQYPKKEGSTIIVARH